MRSLIDYGDIIYDQPQNESFCEKLESVQYKAALAITGAMQETSRDKIYQELGLESLKACVCYFLFFSPNDSPSKTMKNALYFI